MSHCKSNQRVLFLCIVTTLENQFGWELKNVIVIRRELTSPPPKKDGCYHFHDKGIT